jgi:ATP-dependent 26S proteasome regulatory subunit
MTDRAQLEQLILASHPCVIINTTEEDYILKLLCEIAIESTRDMSQWTITDGVRDSIVAESKPIPQTEHPAAALFHLAHDITSPVLCAMLDLPGHQKDERTLRLLRETIEHFDRIGAMLLLIHPPADLPPALTAVATVFEVSFPDKQELESILRETVHSVMTRRQVQVNLSRQGLNTIVRNMQGLSRPQARRVILDAICDDCRLDENDVNAILVGKRQALSSAGMLQFVESPVSLDEVGGLNHLKDWVLRRRPALDDDRAIAFGLLPPRGVLMLGVQGAGKSLAAKAVATAGQMPLLRMDVGSLYDPYIGQSERRLRDALRQAELMSPVVLWIDEIEKAFSSAASASTDGGLSRRMFGALLTWMQERSAPVFLIATANDIEALPPELLRKGRFDEIFFVDLPNLEARTQILEIHIRKRKRDPAKFDIAALGEASAGYSGAEIEQAIISALFDAFFAKAELATAHILAALHGSPPLSVTMAESVAALRAWAADRCVPAD